MADRRTPERQWDSLKPYAWAECSCGWFAKAADWDDAQAAADAHLIEKGQR